MKSLYNIVMSLFVKFGETDAKIVEVLFWRNWFFEDAVLPRLAEDRHQTWQTAHQ